MQISKKAIEDLQEIIRNDYGVVLDDSKAQDVGSSLLHLTQLANTALSRVAENSTHVEDKDPLEPNTSEQ